MDCFCYFSILIVFGVLLLEKWSGGNVITSEKYRDDLQQRNKRQTDCPRPYHVLTTDGRCVWSCGEGTQPDTVTNECVCQRGYYQNGIDQFGRRICSNCPQPYHVLTTDGRCVWSCGEGTQPDTVTNECVCQRGYYQNGIDQFGRRTCSNCPQPYHVLTADGRCVWSCGEGTEPDSVTNECVCRSGYYQNGTDQFGRRVCSMSRQ